MSAAMIPRTGIPPRVIPPGLFPRTKSGINSQWAGDHLQWFRHFPRKDAAEPADVTIDNWVVRAKELYIELTLIASEYLRAIVYDGFIREGHNVTKHWSEFWLVLRDILKDRDVSKKDHYFSTSYRLIRHPIWEEKDHWTIPALKTFAERYGMAIADEDINGHIKSNMGHSLLAHCYSCSDIILERLSAVEMAELKCCFRKQMSGREKT